MHRLKNVRHRRTDAMTQVGWEQLEAMLAVYYRGQGYQVDQCGTGATGSRFDGGIDLKLRKDDAYVIVQCKHWNAKQVTHNAVHELIGVMITERASGAILITSGEFSRYAIESAAKQGHVQLVDGDDLRGMLGPLPALPVSEVGAATLALGSVAAERLLDAAEARIRYGGGRSNERRGRSGFGASHSAGLGILAFKLLLAIALFWALSAGIQSALKSIPSPAASSAQSATAPPAALPAPQTVSPGGVLDAVGQPHQADWATAPGEPSRLSAEDLRERQRLADEAARIIEASTPEM